MARLVCLGGPWDRETIPEPSPDRRVWELLRPKPGAVTSRPARYNAEDAHERELYDVVEVAMGRDQMVPRGYRSHRVLVWSGVPMRDRDALLARDDRPIVDGPRDPFVALLARNQASVRAELEHLAEVFGGRRP